MMHRLGAQPGEWLERGETVDFWFEGRPLQGFRGDTISSALAAAGVPFVGRSFKYHRRRHLLSYANHDSNAMFQVDGVPNVRGDVTTLRAGMRVAAVNTFGGLEQDRARLLDRLGRLLPVGFYYKAFHGRRLFPRWERLFRVLTGLGEVSLDAPRQTTPKRYGFCDVLVIGAGPSGLAAALAAAAAGASVTLVEESPRLGGSGNGRGDGTQRATQKLIADVAAAPSISVCCATVASAYYADHWVALTDGTRLTKMRAKAVVFATGVIEQPAVFRNNDLPGIMLASGAWRLLSRQAVAPGRRVVIVAGNAEAYRVGLDLLAAGVAVAAIVDLRPASAAEPESGACAAAGIQILSGHAPCGAQAGPDGSVASLEVAPFDGRGRVEAAAGRRLECDAVLMSVGWAAAANLPLHGNATTFFSPELQQYVPERLPAGTFACGRLNGVYDLEPRLADGARAGALAAAHAGFASAGGAAAVDTAQPVGRRPQRRPSHPFPIVDHPAGKNFVDFDEDLQVKDLVNAALEGFDSSELLKRYSTVGMGPSQGKHSNMNALRILARHRGTGVAELGLTTARPMYHPVPLKLLAGRSFNAERRTPLDALHAAAGAVWMPAGNWRRPEYYAAQDVCRADCIQAEVAAVRHAAGLIDVGTLGKIEIFGPDAGKFLDRVYTGRFADLKVGMSRYGLMVDESGVIIDDGVIARLAPESFYFTTTTGGSATVFRELLRLNALWGLDCALVNLTGHRAAFNFAGPLCRELLRPLTGVNLDEEAFPYLGVRHGRIAGAAARLLRVGFVGELGYEIHLSAEDAAGVWQALLDSGAARGVRPFGVEAQRLLRLEKGHFIIGQDSDGLTDPFEASAGWAVDMKKPFFVGQRSLKILKARGPRQVLMGIELDDPARLPKECHLVIADGEIAGRVTSVAYSRTLGKAIGLAMLAPALARVGAEIRIRGGEGAMLGARVVATPFYDPKNSRQRAAGSA